MLALTPELAALCHRDETDPGLWPGQVPFQERDYNDAAGHLLDDHGPGPLWVFAYGSLLWRPAGPVAERRHATAHGWQRSFCLEIRRWRGSPVQPGLMMGLTRGGSCEGLVLRLPDVERHAGLVKLLRREIDDAEDLCGVRWINVETPEETIPALAFWADPRESPIFVEPDIFETARILARACGHIGSGAEYLQKTVARLEELAIHDPYLWRLQQLVAAEIKKSLVPLA
jgi:cation transport protein ChaC